MENRTVPALGGVVLALGGGLRQSTAGELELGNGMHVDPVVWLDWRYVDRSPGVSTALDLGAAKAMHNALGELIDDLEQLTPVAAVAAIPGPRVRRQRRRLGGSASSRAIAR
jgi:hypothetical protein